MERNLNVTDNKDERRFEVDLNGAMAFIEYQIKNDKIYLNHTEVPKAMQGKGIASTMTEKAFSLIEQKNLKIVPVCPFIKEYIDKNPRFRSLLA